MQISGLWRYPVKSLGGEALESATISLNGITGDRVVHVRDAQGPLTGRTHPGLLTLHSRIGPDGEPEVGGHPWHSPAAHAQIQGRAGEGAELASYEGPERFDVLNLLVATDGAVERFGHDVRRLRPNLLVAEVPADAEATWPGQALAIGDVLIGVHSLRQRCIVTSIDPDTGEQDLEVFRRIRQEFANQLALNCWVISPGRVALGDEVRLVPTSGQPLHLGGWVVGAPYDPPPPSAGEGSI